MKRLFRIGAGQFVFSFMPLLSWICLSFVLGDNRISNVFSLTYAIQFVYSVFVAIFGSGANIRKEKEKDNNATQNGMFWGTIFATIIFAIPLVFVDQFIVFFGQEVEFYKPYVIFAIALLYVQTLLAFVIQKLYFEDKEKLANIHLFSFNILQFVLLIGLSALLHNKKLALIITLLSVFIYVIVLFIWKFEKFKIDFKFYKNIKYESSTIITALFFLIIYLFGFKNAFSAGPEYLMALNLVSICTDSQWDALNAISTVAKVDISKDRYEYKKELKRGYCYTSILILSSIIMTLVLSYINKVSFLLVFAYLIFQVLDMLADPFVSIIDIYTQLNYSATINSILKFLTLLIRSIISVALLSPFCTDIAQVSETIILIIVYLVIRIKKYKVIDGKLSLKSVTCENKNDIK